MRKITRLSHSKVTEHMVVWLALAKWQIELYVSERKKKQKQK